MLDGNVRKTEKSSGTGTVVHCALCTVSCALCPVSCRVPLTGSVCSRRRRHNVTHGSL